VGDYDPVKEVDFVEREMDQWLAGIVDDNWESVERKGRSPDFDIDDALRDMLTGFGATEYDVATVLRAADYPDEPGHWSDDDREDLARRIREQTKPIVVVANKVDIAPEENVQRLLESEKPVVPATADGELSRRHNGTGSNRFAR
jgi:hypothetical protein